MVPRVAGSIPVNRPSLIKKEVIEFLQKTKHIQALSIHISFKKYANYHKDIEKSAETAKSRTFLFRGDDEYQVFFDENDNIQSMMSFHHKAPE